MDQFIERKTTHLFRNGALHIYETNCPSFGLDFEFDKYLISMMVSGHKTIVSENLKVEFFPDFIFIPEKEVVQHVDIPNANFTNPTKCFLLEVDPYFLEDFYFKLVQQNQEYKCDTNNSITHFISNNVTTVEAFKRLCNYIVNSNSDLEDDINSFILKEVLTRLFQTKAKQLLVQNFQNSLADKAIEKVILFIKSNLVNKITIDDLIEVSNLGKTNLFNRFNQSLKMSPVNFILKERIAHSKKIMRQAESLQSVAYQSGFNTYEHFYKSFKKIEGITPIVFRKNLTKKGNQIAMA